MRVIAGKARGVPLVAAKGLHVRPTLDRVKTSMFNILGDRVVDAVVLDLFSGSGALGIEALSRGGASCVFVERTKSCLASVRANLDKTRLAEFASTLAGDVFGILRRLPQGAVFDLVLAAPPYRMVDEAPSRRRLWQWLAGLASGEHFAPEGMVVLEHRKQRIPLAFPEPLEACDSRTYGDTTLCFLRRKN